MHGSTGSALFTEGAVVAAPAGELVDLDEVPAEELEAMISAQAAHIAAAEALLQSVRRLAERIG